MIPAPVIAHPFSLPCKGRAGEGLLLSEMSRAIFQIPTLTLPFPRGGNKAPSTGMHL